MRLQEKELTFTLMVINLKAPTRLIRNMVLAFTTGMMVPSILGIGAEENAMGMAPTQNLMVSQKSKCAGSMES